MYVENGVFIFDLKGTTAPNDNDPAESYPLEEQLALVKVLSDYKNCGRTKIVIASLADEAEIRAQVDKYSLGAVVDELVQVPKVHSGGPKSYRAVLERMKMSPLDAQRSAVVTGDQFVLDRPDVDGMLFIHHKNGLLHDPATHLEVLQTIDATGQGNLNLGHRMLVGGSRRLDLELITGRRIVTLSRDEIRHGNGPLIRTPVVSI